MGKDMERSARTLLWKKLSAFSGLESHIPEKKQRNSVWATPLNVYVHCNIDVLLSEKTDRERQWSSIHMLKVAAVETELMPKPYSIVSVKQA
jgi:hypothetical protein